MSSIRRGALGLLLLLISTGVAQAQEGADESRATTFQAVEGPQKENVPGGPLLVTAYGFVLAALLGYVVRLAVMQRKTSAEVVRLAAILEQKRKA
jgi:hypothetical protein